MISARTESSTVFLLADSMIINRPLDFRSYSGLNLGGWLLAAGLVAVPVFFAGSLLAHEFRSPPSPSAALAENRLRAVLGGLRENLSLAIGRRALLWMVALRKSGCGTHQRRNPQSSIPQESVNQAQLQILTDLRRMQKG
jgi:hypothetical protein